MSICKHDVNFIANLVRKFEHSPQGKRNIELKPKLIAKTIVNQREDKKKTEEKWDEMEFTFDNEMKWNLNEGISLASTH